MQESELKCRMANKKATTGNQAKIQKNVELVSFIASAIQDMDAGQRMRITPFAKSIILSNNSHPHVKTVQGKLMEAFLWKEVTRGAKFYIRDNQVMEIEKVDPEEEASDSLLRREIRSDLITIRDRLNHLDTMQQRFGELLKKMEGGSMPVKRE